MCSTYTFGLSCLHGIFFSTLEHFSDRGRPSATRFLSTAVSWRSTAVNLAADAALDCWHRVHFVLIVVYNAWIMFVLALKYREFSVVRMHYLTKGV